MKNIHKEHNEYNLPIGLVFPCNREYCGVLSFERREK